jgi:hypothetical protein
MTIQDNGWDDAIVQTVKHWQSVCVRLSDVYDQKADTYRLRIRRLSKIMLIVNLVTMISGILDLSDDTLAYKIIIITTAALTEIVSGYMTIEDLSGSLEIHSRYNERLKQFLGVMASELSVPKQFRTAGDIFLGKYKDQYQTLLIEKPNVIGADMHYSNIEKERATVLHRQLPDFFCAKELPKGQASVQIRKLPAAPNTDVP